MSFFSRSNYEVAELTWENGQLAMHGLLPTTSTKATCSTRETLESIVNQATYPTKELNSEQRHQNPEKISSLFASSDGKWGENSCPVQMNLGIIKKRIRSEPEQQGRNMTSSIQEECADCGAWASTGAAFCRDDDTTMMTWASFESPRSLRTKTMDEDSVSHGGVGSQDKEDRTRRETARSLKSRKRNHAAAIHNQSERRRRDRINQKMKDLQKLVPNASKTDKASMLDEVIAYLKQLQAQVHMMSLRNMPQVMMPLGMQQHLQMSSLLPHIGVNVGLGTVPRMLDLYSIAHAAAAAAPPPPHSLPPLIQPTTVPTAASPSFVPPTFLMPHLTLQHNPDARTNTSGPFNDPYSAFLAQSMHMELYNKMASHYQQQVNQATPNINRPSQSNHIQGD